MKSSQVLLSDLNATSKGYKVKCRVIENTLVGNRMRGALFGDQVENYKDAFVYNGVYEIANAPIKPCDDRWKTDPADLSFQMTFGRQTVIQPIDEQVRTLLPDYKEISQKPKVGYANEKFDLLGIVLYIEEAARLIVTAQNRERFVREIFVIDQSSEQPLTISAWNDLAQTECASLNGWPDKFTVVGFTALKVSSHKGFSLATTMSTTFITSPTGDMAVTLEKWATMNQQLLLDTQNQILNVRCSVGGTHVISIAGLLAKQVKNTIQEEKHRLEVLIPDPEFHKLNAYLGCSNCGKKTDMPACHKFDCDWCSKKGTLCCPRVTFHCDVSDETGTLPLTFFTIEAEQLFGAPAEDLFRIKHTDEFDAFHSLTEKLQTNHTIIEVGPKGILARNGILQWVLKKVVQQVSVATTTPTELPHETVPTETEVGDSATPAKEPFSPPPKKTCVVQSAKGPSTPEHPLKSAMVLNKQIADQTTTNMANQTQISSDKTPPLETLTPPKQKTNLLASAKPPSTPEQAIKVAAKPPSTPIHPPKLEPPADSKEETKSGRPPVQANIENAQNKG